MGGLMMTSYKVDTEFKNFTSGLFKSLKDASIHGFDFFGPQNSEPSTI